MTVGWRAQKKKAARASAPLVVDLALARPTRAETSSWGWRGGGVVRGRGKRWFWGKGDVSAQRRFHSPSKPALRGRSPERLCRALPILSRAVHTARIRGDGGPKRSTPLARKPVLGAAAHFCRRRGASSGKGRRRRARTRGKKHGVGEAATSRPIQGQTTGFAAPRQTSPERARPSSWAPFLVARRHLRAAFQPPIPTTTRLRWHLLHRGRWTRKRPPAGPDAISSPGSQTGFGECACFVWLSFEIR